MAWQASKTSVRQTAINGAVNLVAAGLTLEDVKDNFESIRDYIFEDLQSFVAEDAKSNPGTRAGGGAASGRAGGASGGGGSKDPGTFEFKSGKHAGKSVAQVADEDSGYIEWYAEKATKEGQAFMRRICQEFLDNKRVGE